MTDRQPKVDAGQGYVNLEDGSAYGGAIEVYPNWVSVTTADDSKYTIPRSNVDFVNWKSVQGI